jgi:hypothetical protein
LLRAIVEVLTKEQIKRDELSSKKLGKRLNMMHKNLYPLLGKRHGCVILQSDKLHLESESEIFKANLQEHQKPLKRVAAHA